MKKIIFKALKIIGVSVFWIAIWALISLSVNNEILFPTPISVVKALTSLVTTADFWLSTGISLVRVFLGILISIVIGILLAVLTVNIRILDTLLSPLLSVVKATPVASFIILAWLWINSATLPIFITSLIVIPIVWSNVCEGIRSVDNSLLEVTKVYKFSTYQKLYRLYLPSVAPFFMAACKSALGLAWKAGISAEVLTTPRRAIGTELYLSKTYLELPTLFAWTLVVIILSMVFEKLFITGIEKIGSKLRILPKGGSNDKA